MKSRIYAARAPVKRQPPESRWPDRQLFPKVWPAWPPGPISPQEYTDACATLNGLDVCPAGTPRPPPVPKLPMQLPISTWPDGTPKTVNNAFSVQPAPTPLRPTKQSRKRATRPAPTSAQRTARVLRKNSYTPPDDKMQAATSARISKAAI